jgi:hypothetical protein
MGADPVAAGLLPVELAPLRFALISSMDGIKKGRETK